MKDLILLLRKSRKTLVSVGPGVVFFPDNKLDRRLCEQPHFLTSPGPVDVSHITVVVWPASFACLLYLPKC